MSRFTGVHGRGRCLSYLADLGYAVLHGPDIAPGEPRAERASYDEVVLAGRLEAAIARLNPRLRDGDIAVFRSNPAGSRNGKIVLAEYRGPADPDTGGSYTVKRYRSEKRDSDGSWEHGSIALEPLNPDFVPIVVSPADAEDLRIVAELVEVLPRA